MSLLDATEVMESLKELRELMVEYERRLTAKETEITSLKDDLHNVAEKMDEQAKVVLYLHQKNFKIEQELNDIRESHKHQNSRLTQFLSLNKEDNIKIDGKSDGSLDMVDSVGSSHEAVLFPNDSIETIKNRKACSSFQKPARYLQHIGGSSDTIISCDNTIEFKMWSTVALPRVVLQRGSKVCYEVTFIQCGRETQHQIGWATQDFFTQPEIRGVGECVYSYGIDGTYKLHNEYVESGKEWGTRFKAKCGCVVGVAADLCEGKLLFGLDGNWTTPMGVAFSIEADAEISPALSAQWVTVVVNLGQVPFKYGPPDSSYQPLNAALS